MIFNVTDVIAYFASRDFLSLPKFPTRSIEFLDFMSCRMVNKDVINKITNGNINEAIKITVIYKANKLVAVWSHTKRPGVTSRRFIKIGK
jgi:hypothetical protein